MLTGSIVYTGSQSHKIVPVLVRKAYVRYLPTDLVGHSALESLSYCFSLERFPENGYIESYSFVLTLLSSSGQLTVRCVN